jgi:hypothetical protein
MRYREQSTLLKRTLKSGKIIYYFRSYDEKGNRNTAKSTGQSTKTAARTYCNELLKLGNPIKSKDLSFAEYSKDWWIYDKWGNSKQAGGSACKTSISCIGIDTDTPDSQVKMFLDLCSNIYSLMEMESEKASI